MVTRKQGEENGYKAARIIKEKPSILLSHLVEVIRFILVFG